jgi:hypothetical protein
MNWLEAQRSAQAEEGATPKKRKLQPPQARSAELFESDNEDDIAPTATEEPLYGSGSEADKETDSISTTDYVSGSLAAIGMDQ